MRRASPPELDEIEKFLLAFCFCGILGARILLNSLLEKDFVVELKPLDYVIYMAVVAYCMYYYFRTLRKWKMDISDPMLNKPILDWKIFVTFPLLLGALEALLIGFNLPIFASDVCPHPIPRDYAWFILDNVAKGALFDLLQSFNINLYTCKPDHTFLVGCLNFTIRSFVTVVVIRTVWFFLQWKIIPQTPLLRKISR